MKPFLVLACALALSTSHLHAQERASLQWSLVYDGRKHPPLGILSPMLDRHGWLWGIGTSTHSQDMMGPYENIRPMRFSPSGDTTFFEVYDSTAGSSVFSSSMALDDSGSAYVTGFHTPDIVNTEGVLLRYGSNGRIDWVRHYPLYPAECKVLAEPSGKIVLAISDRQGIHLWRLDSHATVLDSSVIRCDTAQLSIGSIVAADSGFIYVTGSRSWSYLEPPCMPILYSVGQIEKLDPHFGIVWQRSPAISGKGLLDRQGNLIVMGSAAVIKYSRNGDSLWQAVPLAGTQLLDVATDFRCRVIVCGMGTEGTPADGVACYDSLGNLVWDLPIFFSGPRYELWSVCVDTIDNVYTTGIYTDMFGASSNTIIKYTPSGTKIWQSGVSISGATFSMGKYVGVDKDGNVYLVGGATGAFGGGFFAAKIVQVPTGIKVLPGQSLPPLPVLLQNFPNPFNPSTTIRYALPTSSMVRVIVYDVLGREVSVLVNERRNAGVYEVQFDGKNLVSGVYFYRLQAGFFVQTKKLLLVR